MTPIEIDVPFGRLDIADYLGLTAETISREISKLKRDGLISTRGPHKLIIRRLRALRHVARMDVDEPSGDTVAHSQAWRYSAGSTNMSKFADVAPQRRVGVDDVGAQNWEHSLHAALDVLREIDTRYARDRARLEASVGVTPIKRHWLAQLEAQCRKEREPLVLRVADIHQRMTFASLHTMH